jgi:hypothetical protein
MWRTPAPPYRLIMTIPAVGWGLRPAGPLTDPAGAADEVRRIRRSPRDWAADAGCFLLAVGFTVITVVDGLDRNLDPVPLGLDVISAG